jgi:hypothetical protein
MIESVPREAASRIVSSFMDVACGILPRLYAPACCVAATRITVDVLSRLQVSMRPLAVQAVIYNPALVAKGGLPTSAEEALRWRDQDHAAIGICGYSGTRREGHWSGHLVAIACEQWLIDLSLPQMNRHEQGVVLPPIVCGVGSAFLAGMEHRGFELNGCRISYEAFPADESYTGAPDWRDSARHRPATRAILEQLTARGMLRKE